MRLPLRSDLADLMPLPMGPTGSAGAPGRRQALRAPGDQLDVVVVGGSAVDDQTPVTNSEMIPHLVAMADLELARLHLDRRDLDPSIGVLEVLAVDQRRRLAVQFVEQIDAVRRAVSSSVQQGVRSESRESEKLTFFAFAPSTPLYLNAGLV